MQDKLFTALVAFNVLSIGIAVFITVIYPVATTIVLDMVNEAMNQTDLDKF